jgi:cytochrome P450
MQKLCQLMEHWSKIMEIGSTPPVDVFPFLKYIPERFLGNWKARTLEVQREMCDLYGEIVRHVMHRWKTSSSRGCFMDKVLDQNRKLGLNDHQLYFLGEVALEGGSDTSSSVSNTCMHALVQWPENQKKAQKEIDSVVDDTRTPIWSDFAKPPYVSQVIKEAQRWRPVGGLGIPRVLTEGKEAPDSEILA